MCILMYIRYLQGVFIIIELRQWIILTLELLPSTRPKPFFDGYFFSVWAIIIVYVRVAKLILLEGGKVSAIELVNLNPVLA